MTWINYKTQPATAQEVPAGRILVLHLNELGQYVRRYYGDVTYPLSDEQAIYQSIMQYLAMMVRDAIHYEKPIFNWSDTSSFLTQEVNTLRDKMNLPDLPQADLDYMSAFVSQDLERQLFPQLYQPEFDWVKYSRIISDPEQPYTLLIMATKPQIQEYE